MTQHDEKLTRKINVLESIDRKSSLPAEDLLKLLPIEKKNRILDLGAGTGFLAIPAARKTDGTVYALDLDVNILAYLATKAKKENVHNIQTVEGNFKDIPLEDDSINITLASLALHEVNPLSEALQDIYRVTANNGYLLCVELEKHEKSSGPRIHSSVMEEALRNARFTITEKIFPENKIMNEPVYIIIAQKKA